MSMEPVVVGILGLLIALIATGAIAVWLLTLLRREEAERAALSAGTVLLFDDGVVVGLSAEALAYDGLTPGLTMAEALSRILGSVPADLLAAVELLHRNGRPLQTLATAQDGRVFDISGAPHGSQIRLVFHEATTLAARLAEAEAQAAAVSDRLLRRHWKDKAVAALLERGATMMWCRTLEGGILWSEGAVGTAEGTVTADAALALVQTGAPLTEPGPTDPPDAPRRYRIEVGGATGSVPLQVVEVEADGRFFGFAVDATEASTSERMLTRFVQTMTESFADLDTGLAIFDRDGALVLFNPAATRLWGLSPGWLAQRPNLRELLDRLRTLRRIPEVANYHAWRDRLTDLCGAGAAVRHDEHWHLSDGTELAIGLRAHPKGSLAMVLEDVSQRAALERRIAQAEAQFRDTLDRLEEGLIVVGGDGRLRFVNAAFHRIWSTEEEAFGPGIEIGTLARFCEDQTVETALWSRIVDFATGAALRESWRERMRLSSGRIVRAEIAPMPDGAAMAVFVDVTDGETIARALTERNDALEMAEALRGAVLERIAKSLDAPLAALREAPDDPLARAEAVERIDEVVGEAAALAALPVAAESAEDGEVSVDAAIVLTRELLETRARERGVRLSLAVQAPIGRLRADAGRLRQILFSLAGGAVARAETGTAVAFGAEKTAGGIAIFVEEPEGEAGPPDTPLLARLVQAEGGYFVTRPAGAGKRRLVCHFSDGTVAQRARGG